MEFSWIVLPIFAMIGSRRSTIASDGVDLHNGRCVGSDFLLI